MHKVRKDGPARRAIAALRAVTGGAVIVLFSFMVLSVAGEIVGRYFGVTISNAVETATFAQIWLTAIGASVALRQGSMFALDTLTRHLPLGPARALSVLIAALGLILVGVLFYGGLLLTDAGTRQTSPVMQIRMWTIFIALPIGMALLAIEIVLQVVERWHAPFDWHAKDEEAS